jgi:DNA-binding NtrC family response regulator
VIFITVKDDNTSLIEGFRAGGVDYITKPFEKEELLTRVGNHLKISHLTQELLQKNEELQQEIDRREQEEKARERAEDALQKADDHLELISQQETARWGIDAFVGKSSTIKGILDEVHQLQSARRTSILIVGESGTGKELIARAIHFGGERAGEPFIPVNCSAIPRDYIHAVNTVYTFYEHTHRLCSVSPVERAACSFGTLIKPQKQASALQRESAD